MQGALNNLLRVMIAVLIMVATVLLSVGERSIRPERDFAGDAGRVRLT